MSSQGEWELASRWAQWLFRQIHRPNLDLFAMAANATLPTFCSSAFHPSGMGGRCDMSISWDRMDVYAFLPFSIIHRVLLKIRASRARVLLVAPMCPWQQWLSLLLHLLVDHPVTLSHVPDLVSQGKSRVLHPWV